jgi:rubrerythrin
MSNKRISELIETAIRREEAAYAFYMDLNEKVDDASTKETLEWMAGEEEKHKKFLIDYRDGGFSKQALRMSDVVYYKIAEYQKEPEIEKTLRREDVFLLASHRELRSYNFYTELAKLHPEGELNDILMKIANEELKHKEKMEYLYANTAFPQTAGG